MVITPVTSSPPALSSIPHVHVDSSLIDEFEGSPNSHFPSPPPSHPVQLQTIHVHMPQMCSFPQPQHQFPAPFPYFPCLLEGHPATIFTEQHPQSPEVYPHSSNLHHPDLPSVRNEHFHPPHFPMQQYRGTCTPSDEVHSSSCNNHPGLVTRNTPTPPLPPHQVPMGPRPLHPYFHDQNFTPPGMHPVPHPSSPYRHLSFPPPPIHYPSPSHIMSPCPFAFSPAHSSTAQPIPLPHQCLGSLHQPCSSQCPGLHPSQSPCCSDSSPHPGIHSHHQRLSHCHFSPITHHSSPSRHPSPTLQHLSPSTRHPSPSTRHPSPSSQHPSPLSRHPSPLSRHPSPLSQHPSPLSRHLSPLSRHMSPSPRSSSPRHHSPSSSPHYKNHHKHDSHYNQHQRSISTHAHGSFSRAMRPPPLVLARQVCYSQQQRGALVTAAPH